MDIIEQAIREHKQITFQYLSYTPDKILALRHDGYLYNVSPFATCWHDDHYYLIGHSQKHGQIATFRIDRLEHTKLTDEKAVDVPESFDLADYSNQLFEMYGGEVQTIVLQCKNYLMDVIVDKFGTEVATKRLDDQHFIAEVTLSVSPRFYGWLFGFMGGIRILEPEWVRKEYQKQARKASK